MNTRSIILHILEQYDKRPWAMENLVEQELQASGVDHRDRRFIFEIVYGIVRHRLTIDYVIEQYLNDRSLMDNKHLKRVLEIGLYQIMYMDKVPDHAAVNETVDCARIDARSKTMTGIVNGILRSFIKDKKRIALPDPKKDLVKRLSIEFSHPQWMVERWLKRLALSKTKLLLAFNNEKPETYFRRKIHGRSRPQFETESRDVLSSVGGYLNLYYRLSRQLQVESMDLLKDGHCTIQAPSSGWMVALLDVQKGETVLDVCSAPGGKSALVSELAGETGKVYSCELKWARMMLVRDTVKRMRLSHVSLCLCDGRLPPFSRRFHKILLDAPCTGSGVLHRHPEARWVKNLEDISKLAIIQEKLLEACASLTAPGGVLVYSTCSLEPEENELLVEAFLQKHPEFVLSKAPAAVPATFIDRSGYVRITPYDHKLDGMFGARLQKIERVEK
ncbi:MAG: 16S rRNA (cytosine(967)-C(5))-methyltransferase RsmB [Chitinivibrionales bacterium]